MILESTKSPISIFKETFTKLLPFSRSSTFPEPSDPSVVSSASGGLISIFRFSMDDIEVAADPII